MKTSSLIVLMTLACGGVAIAQDQAGVQGQAAAGSRTSVSAGQEGASAGASGSASGSAAAQSDTDAAQLAGGTELNAALSKSVDVRKAKPGDEVIATVTQDAASDGGVVIAKGSKLVGRVTEAEPRGRASSSGRGESRLGIVFDRAILKDGREVPVNAAIQAIGSARAAASGGFRDAETGMSGAGRTAGAARASGGGLVGTVGGAAGAAAGVGGTVGSSLDGTAGVVGKSAGAVGGFNAVGALSAGSRGVFGMPGLEIASVANTNAAGSAQGSLITSTTRNVRLGSGTRMLLVTGADAGTAKGAAGASGGARASGAANGSATRTP